MKFKIRIALLFFVLVAVGELVNAQVPVPAGPQLRPVYIVGATAHLGNGEVVENSIIAFEGGKLTLVRNPESLPKVNLSRYRIIEAKGKHAYPGFIAPNTQLGLVEIGAVRATRDYNEVGEMNPSVRALIAYNTDSQIIPTVRSMGVLTAQIVPEGGRIQGQSSIVQLDAWNWEDAVYKEEDGMHLDWPSQFRYSRRERRYSKNDNYEEQIREVEQFFEESGAYHQRDNIEETNLKFEAMKPLFEKKMKLYIHANDAKSITHAVAMAGSYGLSAVIVGGRDSWMVADLLSERKVPVILRETHSLPGRTFEDIDQPFKTPALLQKAGVSFCFGMDGYWQFRNLAFQAGQAVGYGLGYEEAISALTRNAAIILGVDDTTGTLEEGKDATLFICEGDVLDMRTSKVVQAFIQGREIDLDNKQKELYRKYQQKYEQGR